MKRPTTNHPGIERTFLRKDLAQNKLISITLSVFMLLAATLSGLTAVVTVQLLGSVDQLLEAARAPHFLQMHNGPVDQQRFDDFVAAHPEIEHAYIQTFLNLDGDAFVFGDRTLGESMQDNGLVVQNPHYDQLLDLQNQAIEPQPGELYLPLAYEDLPITPGMTATIHGHPFTVRGYLRDAQMNATLASSKRFLVHEDDFERLEPHGTPEALISLRLHQMDDLTRIESTYVAAGLESNGPTLTYPLFRIINALSDGMMIALLLLTTWLVLAIALLCIRFTLLTRMEDDLRTLFVMRAIGLPRARIRRLYQNKYRVLALISGALGLLAAWLLQAPLLRNIERSMGLATRPGHALILAILAIALLLGVIDLFIRRVFARLYRQPPAPGLRQTHALQAPKRLRMPTLARSRHLTRTGYLTLSDLLMRPRIYLTILVLMILFSFLLLIPQNLSTTLRSECMMRYMGIGSVDVTVNLRGIPHPEQLAATMQQHLEQDPDVHLSSVMLGKPIDYHHNGLAERIPTEQGDHTRFPLHYIQGRSPEREGELAISVMQAEELGWTLGTTLDYESTPQTVVGLYSDVTNGGKTAKLYLTEPLPDPSYVSIGVRLAEGVDADAWVQRVRGLFPTTQIASSAKAMQAMYGSTLDGVERALTLAWGVSAVICFTVVTLFIRMLLARDRSSLRTLSALGFPSRDLRAPYRGRMVMVGVLGILLGTLLANTLGEALCGLALSSMGVASFDFVIQPLTAYILVPLTFILMTLLAVQLALGAMRHPLKEAV